MIRDDVLDSGRVGAGGKESYLLGVNEGLVDGSEDGKTWFGREGWDLGADQLGEISEAIVGWDARKSGGISDEEVEAGWQIDHSG